MAEGADAAGAGGAIRRFVLEHHPVRGFWTQLDEAWRHLSSLHRYAAPVEALLGEAVTATVLLAATLKFQGRLSLQLQGGGLVRLLIAQCTHDFRIRAVARLAEGGDAEIARQAAESADFATLVGAGQLTVTIDADERAARYQGIVALEGDSLAACLERYFASSEQLPTRITLAADAVQASGLLVQKLPAGERDQAPAAQSQAVWEDVQANLGALSAEALRARSAEQLLREIGGTHDSRLFSAAPVRFACGCSRERVAGILRALGEREINGVLAEQGAVGVNCEFCGRTYRFDSIDVRALFADGATPLAPPRLN